PASVASRSRTPALGKVVFHPRWFGNRIMKRPSIVSRATAGSAVQPPLFRRYAAALRPHSTSVANTAANDGHGSGRAAVRTETLYAEWPNQELVMRQPPDDADSRGLPVGTRLCSPAVMPRALVAERLAVRAWMLLSTLTLCFCDGGRADAQTIRQDFYATNGTVSAAVLSGNTLYIAGSFTEVGPATGGFVPIDTASALPVSGFP